MHYIALHVACVLLPFSRVPHPALEPDKQLRNRLAGGRAQLNKLVALITQAEAIRLSEPGRKTNCAGAKARRSPQCYTLFYFFRLFCDSLRINLF